MPVVLEERLNKAEDRPRPRPRAKFGRGEDEVEQSDALCRGILPRPRPTKDRLQTVESPVPFKDMSVVESGCFVWQSGCTAFVGLAYARPKPPRMRPRVLRKLFDVSAES